MDFSKFTVVVCGGLGDIAYSINSMFLENGVKHLALIDLKENDENLGKLQRAYEDRTILYQQGDITKKADIQDFFKKVRNAFGSFDILVNCAGILKDNDVEQTFLVNSVAPINSSLEAIELMGKHNGNNGGIIINIASTAGIEPSWFTPLYSASKHALVGFSRSLMNKDFQDRVGVKFIVICPGVTNTRMLMNCDSAANFRYPNCHDMAQEFLKTLNVQSPQVVADCVLMALNDVDDQISESVWLSDSSYNRKVPMHVYWTGKESKN